MLIEVSSLELPVHLALHRFLGVCGVQVIYLAALLAILSERGIRKTWASGSL